MPEPPFLLAQPAGDAVLSPCGTYRYTLHRGCGSGDTAVNFLLLNPSTADARKDDPTIRRLIGYARGWGHGGLVVTNLFALRSTDPGALRLAPNPIGTENDRHILEQARGAALVVAGWGVHGGFRGRSLAVRRLLAEAGIRLHVLRLTQDGEPRHPLYLPGNLAPIPWEVDRG